MKLVIILSLLSLTLAVHQKTKRKKTYVKRYKVKRQVKKNDKSNTSPNTLPIQAPMSFQNLKKDGTIEKTQDELLAEVEEEIKQKQAAQSVAIVDIMVDQAIEKHSDEGQVGFPALYKQLAKHAFLKQNKTIPVETMRSAFEQRANQGFRSSASPFFNLDDIWNYGCFCRFGRDWRKSHGKPMNDIDKVCQQLYFCYKCVEFDGFAENDDACDSVEDLKYDMPVTSTVYGFGSYVACSEANDGELCKIRKCCCDVAFGLKLISFFFDPNGVYVDGQYKHDIWDPSEHCPTCQGDNCRAEKDCCGTYPDRFPYAPRNGERGCCLDRTYSTSTMCCDTSDMTVKRVGQCPAPSYP